jgi:S-adenosylmethionine decarboxylase
MFGPHLTLDCYGCDKKKLKSVEFIAEFLDKMPSRVSMTKIMPPYVFKYSGLKPEDWGVSGIVLIAESHISIHTFPEKGFASVDIFSCKEFDVEQAADVIISELKAKTYEKNMFNRGRHFPKDVWRNGQMLEMQREQKEAVEQVRE